MYKKEILSVGICQMKSHTFQKNYAKHPDAIYLHAEVAAIKNALNSRIDLDILSRSTLYIVRRKRSVDSEGWVQGLSKPCSGCQKCIDSYGLKRVIYTLDINGYAVID